MENSHLWNQSKNISIQTSPEIVGGFSIGFDARIPETIKDRLMHFVYWVEDNYSLPVTLWVDFQYKHYLLTGDKKRVGYKFYCADFKNYPAFDNPDDIPVIELPVRIEHSSIEEILFSFIEAISLYYAWLTNTITDDYRPDVTETAEILYNYLNETNQEVLYDHI